jgi:hypothetical protein
MSAGRACGGEKRRGDVAKRNYSQPQRDRDNKCFVKKVAMRHEHKRKVLENTYTTTENKEAILDL